MGNFKSRSRVSVASVGGAAVMIVFGTMSSASAMEKWNLANAYGAKTLHVEGNQVFADELKDASMGVIEVTVHAGGSLGYKSVDHFDAVSDGAVEIADTPGGFLGGIDPLMTLSSLPFLVKTVEEAKILKDIAFPEYEKVFEKAGQKLLYASPWPASGIWAKMPVTSSEKLKGLKIRTYDPGGTKTFQKIGAAPIQLAWGDVAPQLATGGISAVLTSAEGGVAQKFVEHTAYFTEINYALPLNFVHMNKDVYDGLSEGLRKAVDMAAEKASQRNWAEVVGRTKRNYDLVKKDGGTVVTTEAAAVLGDLSEAGTDVMNEWLSKVGDRGQQIIKKFRETKG
ncbi:C4-dicarboxylate ABC transporter substrate-binding protein [Sneathiella sp. P13V-1]|uniref:TRAP transporter substrate-binding protein n=1 Tax=Sneathiella sp. P13V-1 TaxID=2697366 RepID=UPI00187B1248|nr:TRAP transporter substrate-binding protein [Sneathiella sp. P13V-1]MBE7638386.1 C4-dicarboxylate ABC transporter substrate-binding protein [Sneathiella sp. P13V-1]